MDRDQEARRPAPHRPRRLVAGPLALLLGGAALALGGCGGALQEALSTPADAASTAGGIFGQPWGGQRPAILDESVTLARLMGAPPAPDVLRPEPGDVWPGPLPPRSTLANPDAALRGIPEYEPSGPRQPVSELAPARPGPRGQPRSSPNLPPSQTFDEDGRLRSSAPLPPPARLPPPPPARTDGQVIHTPGGPVITSGGTDRVQTYTVPGVGGTGTAIRDGNTTTLIGPDGRVQAVPTPSR